MDDSLINDIKNHFFTEQNNSYLIKIINKEVNNDIKSEIFQLQNNIFNNFIQSVYDKDININIIPLENIIISLNKMTIIAYKNQENLTEKAIEKEEVNVAQKEVNVNETPVEKKVKVNLIKEVNVIEKAIEIPIIYHIYSCDYYRSNKLEFKGNARVLYFELYNDLYNINETNNKFEIDEGIRVKISIPFGNYNLEELLNIIEIQLNKNKSLSGNYKLLLNKNKNRIQILNDSDKNFNIFFIDTPNAFTLRNILGFSNIEYINNNSYSSENNPCIEYYDDIFIKLTNTFVPVKTSFQNFSYSKHLSFDSIKTFGEKISFTFTENENYLIENNCEIEFYIRNCNKFQILNKKLKFNMKFQVI